jgi:hypothetical protein
MTLPFLPLEKKKKYFSKMNFSPTTHLLKIVEIVQNEQRMCKNSTENYLHCAKGIKIGRMFRQYF